MEPQSNKIKLRTNHMLTLKYQLPCTIGTNYKHSKQKEYVHITHNRAGNFRCETVNCVYCW